MLLLGYTFKVAIVDPLIRHGVIPLVIATLGLSIGLKQLVKAGVTAQAEPFPSPFPDGLLALGSIKVSYSDVGTLLIAGLIVIGLQMFLNRTVTGRAMQAVAKCARLKSSGAVTYASAESMYSPSRSPLR